MELNLEQKEILKRWILSKDYFKESIKQKGIEAILTEYLKGKSWKRLKHILFHLGARLGN